MNHFLQDPVCVPGTSGPLLGDPLTDQFALNAAFDWDL